MVVELVEPVTPGVGLAPFVSLPGALVLPGPAVLPVPGPPIDDEELLLVPAVGLPVLVSTPAVPEVEPVVVLLEPLMPAVLPDVLEGEVVLGVVDDVVGVGSVASRLVQAPRERAATTARAAAAHWVRDVFIVGTP